MTALPNQLPKCYSEFKHIQRFYDKSLLQPVAKLLPGDYYVTENDELISTVLGSCISVCAYDKKLHIGGMNHFMLPQLSENGSNWDMTSVNSNTRFGNFAMEQLINSMLAKGCLKRNLEFKVFGGGNIMGDGNINVGIRNIAFAHDFLSNEGFKVNKEDVGDIFPRKVLFRPFDGKVKVKKLASVESRSIKEMESAYGKKLETKTDNHGDVELF